MSATELQLTRMEALADARRVVRASSSLAEAVAALEAMIEKSRQTRPAKAEGETT